MTEQPNIKKQLCEYALDETDENGDGLVDLVAFAEKHGYKLNRVIRKANETGVFECGTTMKRPWIRERDRERVRETLREWE